MSDKVDKIESNQQDLVNKVDKLASSSTDQDAAVNAAINELAERAKRESSIVLHSVKEPTSRNPDERKTEDTESILGILDQIGVTL